MAHQLRVFLLNLQQITSITVIMSTTKYIKTMMQFFFMVHLHQTVLFILGVVHSENKSTLTCTFNYHC